MKHIYLILLFITTFSFAQENEKHWLAPDHYKLQFAGNIGFLSAGAGYLHGNSHLETDLYVGYLPKKIGGDDIFSLTAKMTYSPWKIELDKTYHITPFSIGPYISYSFGSQFDTLLPNEYPSGYYWWASSLRFGAFIGGRVTKDTEGKLDHLSFYYELSTYDLKAISYIQNTEYLGLNDIFSLSLGVKFGL